MHSDLILKNYIFFDMFKTTVYNSANLREFILLKVKFTLLLYNLFILNNSRGLGDVYKRQLQSYPIFNIVYVITFYSCDIIIIL